jgi:SAM-dependent methyltransferase
LTTAMITSLLGKIKSSPVIKKYVQPMITNLLEESFTYNKRITGKFIDSYGVEHNLYAGLRDKIKPGWQAMFDPASANKIPAKNELKASLKEAAKNIKSFKKAIHSFNYDLKDKSILEIGCHNGIKTFLLGLEGCKNAVGSDVSFYYEKQSEVNERKKVNSYLDTLRGQVKDLFGEAEKKEFEKKVSFIEDDISNSKIEDNSFDVIASWETLEHIIDTDAALGNMGRILKKGGIAFHEYNPFFSLNGGHSLCTLDFPWGHCRLNEKDFLRYIKEIRPSEVQLAEAFYKDSLNRLTIKDLEKSCEKAGLEIFALIPFVKKAHLSIFENICFEETKRHYPSLTPMDLISPVVWVVFIKQ